MGVLVIGRVVIASLLAAAMVLGQYWPRQRQAWSNACSQDH
jgi:hypothetical protein